MKLVKMALLAATATVAAMAFIGASTASATPPWIAVCLKAELLNCKNLAKHPLLGRLVFLKGKGLFKASFSIECTSGTGKTNEVESQQSGAFKATLEELTAVGCSGGCKAVKFITPQGGELTMEGEATESWRHISINVQVQFFECTFGVTCKFAGNLNLSVKMDAEGIFTDPEGTSFKLIEGSAVLCGSTAKWESGRTRVDWQLDDAKLSIHKNIWLSLIGANLIKAEGTEL